MAPLHSSLGNKSETPSQKKKKKALFLLPTYSKLEFQKKFGIMLNFGFVFFGGGGRYVLVATRFIYVSSGVKGHERKSVQNVLGGTARYFSG